jgi:hypothetical protein
LAAPPAGIRQHAQGPHQAAGERSQRLGEGTNSQVVPGAPIKATVKRDGSKTELVFPFRTSIPAAVFRRADMLWLVFDTDAAVAIGDLNAERGANIRSVSAMRLRDSAVVRVRLDRPQLISVAAEGPVWKVTLANEVVAPTRPLTISRNIVGRSRSSIVIAIEQARRLHRIEDPEARRWRTIWRSSCRGTRSLSAVRAGSPCPPR